jgi:hypothetical protein
VANDLSFLLVRGEGISSLGARLQRQSRNNTTEELTLVINFFIVVLSNLHVEHHLDRLGKTWECSGGSFKFQFELIMILFVYLGLRQPVLRRFNITIEGCFSKLPLSFSS